MEQRRLATTCLAVYAVLSIADVVAELADQALLTRLLPMALMPLLAGFLWFSGPRDAVARWVLVALGFAWLGDCLGDPLLLKIGFFLVTQAAYCLAFRPRWRSSLLARPGPATAYAVVLAGLIAAVSTQAGDLWPAVAVYGVVLALMVALASGVSRLAVVGAATFLASDLVLAYGAFVNPPPGPVDGAAAMATYLTAQLLIVLGTRRATATVETVEGAVFGRR